MNVFLAADKCSNTAYCVMFQFTEQRYTSDHNPLKPHEIKVALAKCLFLLMMDNNRPHQPPLHISWLTKAPEALCIWLANNVKDKQGRFVGNRTRMWAYKTLPSAQHWAFTVTDRFTEPLYISLSLGCQRHPHPRVGRSQQFA